MQEHQVYDNKRLAVSSLCFVVLSSSLLSGLGVTSPSRFTRTEF